MHLPVSSSTSSSVSSAASSSNSSSSTTSTSWLSGIVRGRFDKSSSVKMAHNSASSAGDCRGPVEGKNQFRGVLFKYGPKPIQVAFKTSDYKQQVIFIGGMTDGFLATEYLEPLAIALDKERWSLVQFLMSSSYSGYGISSLQQDAMEIDQLISYLINKEDSEGVVLLGQSTGCQDIVRYMSTNAACSRAVRAAILQAPVSDREYRATLPETAAMIDLASGMINEGRESELMPKKADPSSPITAQRYHSLCAYMGDDDMFSSDLSDDQLRQRLGHMANTPCQEPFDTSVQFVQFRLSIPWVTNTCQSMLTRKHWLKDCAELWVVQRKLKSSMGITRFLTESRKLSSRLLTSLKERDQKAGMIHGTNTLLPVIFFVIFIFFPFLVSSLSSVIVTIESL